MIFTTAITKPEFINLYEKLQNLYPVDYLKDDKTFYKKENIYDWLRNRYQSRIIRYSKSEFMRYFENTLLNSLNTLYTKQFIYQDTMIETIKNPDMRGAISDSLSNNFHSPQTYAKKAIPLTPEDSVSDKAQSKTKNKTFDIILDIKKILDMRLKKPIEEFLDQFNQLFKIFLTEQELQEQNITPPLTDFYMLLKNHIGSSIDINKVENDGKEIITFTFTQKAIYHQVFNILSTDDNFDLDFDDEKGTIRLTSPVIDSMSNKIGEITKNLETTTTQTNKNTGDIDKLTQSTAESVDKLTQITTDNRAAITKNADDIKKLSPPKWDEIPESEFNKDYDGKDYLHKFTISGKTYLTYQQGSNSSFIITMQANGENILKTFIISSENGFKINGFGLTDFKDGKVSLSATTYEIDKLEVYK